MDKDIFYTNVSLSNRYNYTTKFTVLNTPVVMRCGYNIRNNKRWIILYDNYGYVLLPQTFLSKRKKCELNFNANQGNLSGYVTLVQKDAYKKIPNDYDYASWANDFELMLVTNTQDKEQEWDDNYRSLMVSG